MSMEHSENISPHGAPPNNIPTSVYPIPPKFPPTLPQSRTNESTYSNLSTSSFMNSRQFSVHPQPPPTPQHAYNLASGQSQTPNTAIISTAQYQQIYYPATIPGKGISENPQTFNPQNPIVLMQTPQPVSVSQPQANTGMQPPITYGGKQKPLQAINWMSETHIPLKDLHILGTNNSGFFMGRERTQRVDIAEQLRIGIRLIDLMIVQYSDEIYIDQYEHIYELCCPYITLSETLLNIQLFLKRYPNEVVFISLRCKNPNTANKNMEEEPDKIDAELLEAKFDEIKDFILNIEEINLEMTAKILTTSTKKNIICFASSSPCFQFLLEKKLSLNGYQLEATMILDYDITTALEKMWSEQKSITYNPDPYKQAYSWLIIDATTAENDAIVLKEFWEIYNKENALVPFYFFSLCKVTDKTWKDLIELMLSVQGAQ
ncbi:hypothetical protein LOD99_6520 [Oopsacas minuta]|uniref:Uncharacterized protein n=1 Tax=Oopsacas minuta TaxID=111878 RepID=A0AAV7JMW7_9METZ|nr:hypothetical protein LOD99_6520 [Oopsacas minuta]